MEFARMIRSSLRGPRYGFPTTAALLLAMTLTSTVTRTSRGQATDANTIFGVVTEARSGVANVTVCLCDRKYGLPVDRTTYLPIEWGKSQPDDSAERMALVQTDRKGRFEFTDVPNGEYRLIAQRWAGPFQGLFELHGTVIQLHGTADVTVPRPDEYYESQVALRAPGKAVLEFDQKAPNNSTFMFLSEHPPEFDPVLGLQSMGDGFFQNLLGVNRMPLGRTTVIGAPSKDVSAFFFAPDNSPGFAHVRVKPSDSGHQRVPAEPFVAGWSDGRKTPPADLAKLTTYLEEHDLTVSKLLELPQLSAATHTQYRKRMKELTERLGETIRMPDGKRIRVGDLLAVDAYRKLQQ